ncbi:MAG: hypothetical protein CMP38_03565 [Rickettsiales bacterium]|nr:hypothetical protein [Rickettsiales bacterium]|tara:strand:+ start:239 stop:859 length:621 start_codon:yes stop_codon:yes gene_type:complete
MKNDQKIILDKIIKEILDINLIDPKNKVNNKSRNELYEYIYKEFFDISEYQELLSSLKLDKKNISKIIYQFFILINANKNKNQDSINKTKELIIKASNIGFTWPNSKACFKKVEEEFEEFQKSIEEKDNQNIKEEMGDLMFTLQCYANLKNYDFINILDEANNKFERRFIKLKEIAKREKLNIQALSDKKKNKLWEKAKKELKSSK